MPISKKNMKLYPGGSIHSKEWRLIRARLLQESGNRCEGTDRHPGCGRENRTTIPGKTSLVVLTVAHLDHDPRNNDRLNLRVLCQRCHLAYDKEHHMRNAMSTREKKECPQVNA